MERKVIWDLGLNEGSDSLFYLQKGFNVIAVEADPFICQIAREKLDSYIKSGQLIIEECAIMDFNGNVEFTINRSHKDWSSLYSKWNSKYNSETDIVTVKCQTLSSLISKHGDDIYYMKIDLEGYDIACIRQLKGLNIPRYLSAELLTYNNISNEESSSEMFFLLKELGYTKFQLVDQSKNNLVKCPYPSLEGNYVDYKFTGLTSGLFGKELPDNWVNMDKSLLQYLDYFCNKTHQSSWWDLHVTK